mmetsp:Transcript_22932/g.58556  ORF Transcript_22932/g.58556 Transcript_22932/m.58556 type:complete len:317 (-) Transcript_22932:697-1647(-)
MRKALRRDAAAADGVALRGVKARRHNDEVGVELVRDGQQHVVQRADVVAVAHVGAVPGNVDAVALPAPDAHLVHCARARVERAAVVAVDGHVHDRVVVLKDVLRAVAVVDVPVQDEHALRARRLRRLGRHRGVVEEAKAHGHVGLGVVPGRADDGGAVCRLAAGHQLRHLGSATSRQARALVRVRVDVGVAGHHELRLGRAPSCHGVHKLNQLLGVHRSQLLVGGRRALGAHAALTESRGQQARHDRADAVGPLRVRVVLALLVQLHALVVHQRDLAASGGVLVAQVRWQRDGGRVCAEQLGVLRHVVAACKAHAV